MAEPGVHRVPYHRLGSMRSFLHGFGDGADEEDFEELGRVVPVAHGRFTVSVECIEYSRLVALGKFGLDCKRCR